MKFTLASVTRGRGEMRHSISHPIESPRVPLGVIVSELNPNLSTVVDTVMLKPMFFSANQMIVSIRHTSLDTACILAEALEYLTNANADFFPAVQRNKQQ